MLKQHSFHRTVHRGYQEPSAQADNEAVHHPEQHLTQALMIRPKHLDAVSDDGESAPLFIDGHYVRLAERSCFDALADDEGRERSLSYISRVQSLVEALHVYFQWTPPLEEAEQGASSMWMRSLDRVSLTDKERQKYELKSGDILVTARAHRLLIYRFMHPRDVIEQTLLTEANWHYIAHHSLHVMRVSGENSQHNLMYSAALTAWLQSEDGVCRLKEGNMLESAGSWRLTKKFLAALQPPHSLASPSTFKALYQSQTQRIQALLRHRVMSEYSRLITTLNTQRTLQQKPFIPHLFSETKVCREMVRLSCLGTPIDVTHLTHASPLTMQQSDIQLWQYVREFKGEYVLRLKELFAELTQESARLRTLQFVPGVTPEENGESDDFIFEATLMLMMGRSLELARGITSYSESYLHSLSAHIAELIFTEEGAGLIDDYATTVDDEDIKYTTQEASRSDLKEKLWAQLSQVELAHENFKKTLIQLERIGDQDDH